MEGKTKFANKNNIDINRKKSNISKIQKIRINQANFKIFNFLFLEVFLILLKIKKCRAANYIEIEVNKVGVNQIISDEYIGNLPSQYKINNRNFPFENKQINIASTNNKIRLYWDYTISNYSYMFSNLSTITSVHMYYMFGQNNDMSYMFYNCYNLQKYTYDIYYNEAYKIIDMRRMFYNCTSLLYFNFNNLYIDSYYYYNSQNQKVSAYASLSYMFYNCYNLKSIYIGDFESGNKCKYIGNMRGMFYNCFSLTSLNLKGFKTVSGIDLSYMLYNCSKLEIFQDFNYVVSVIDLRYMFYNCSSLKNISLSNFTSSSSSSIISSVSMSGLFYNCYNLNIVKGFTNLYISDTDQMFYNCTSLTNLYFKPKQIREDINMSKMFYNCIKFDINIFAVSDAYTFYPNNLNSIFYNCISLTSLDLRYFRSYYLTDTSYMFFSCKNLNSSSITGISLSNNVLINMKGMFENCESFTSLNLNSFHTPNVEIMWNLFKGCKNIKSNRYGINV